MPGMFDRHERRMNTERASGPQKSACGAGDKQAQQPEKEPNIFVCLEFRGAVDGLPETSRAHVESPRSAARLAAQRLALS